MHTALKGFTVSLLISLAFGCHSALHAGGGTGGVAGGSFGALGSGGQAEVHTGGASGAAGTGGLLGTGGALGSAGRGGASGVGAGSGSGGVMCIPPPCVAPVCPDGYVSTASNTCDCSGPCGCPCGCWTCVAASGAPDASLPRDAGVRPEAYADAPADELVCPPTSCPATSSTIALSGYVDLSAAGASAVDVDTLEITVCDDAACGVLQREPSYDSTATGWACADAGSNCLTRAFGGSEWPVRYALVTLTGTGGNLYAVGGTVVFPFASSVADVASTTSITIQFGNVVILNAASTACTVSFGCCGGNQTCNLSWN
jgi:hypothetical protein